MALSSSSVKHLGIGQRRLLLEIGAARRQRQRLLVDGRDDQLLQVRDSCWISSLLQRRRRPAAGSCRYSSVALIAATAARAALRCDSDDFLREGRRCEATKADAASAAETVRRTRLDQIHDRKNSLVYQFAWTVSDAVGAGDDRHGRQPEEQPVLDDARNGVKSIRQRSCIRNAAKRCIEDQMPAVCNKRLRRSSSSMSAARTGRAPAAARAMASSVAFRPKRLTSIGSGKRPSVVDQLERVGDHDHARRRRRDDLLAQQRAAAALDQATAPGRPRRRRRW